MKKSKNTLFLISLLTLVGAIWFSTGCTSKDGKSEIWIYTSLYKDTIADIQPQLETEFPGVKFNFYQAGSEEVAAKVNTESMAGKIQADILISSDRFWYEDLARQGKLLSYKAKGTEGVPADLKNAEGFYSTLSLPVMVIAYNSDLVPEKDLPKTFKELADPKWKGKITSGSPLASGTNFTSLAFLQKAYGWEYFKALRKNELLAEGGNSGVIRRLQNKEKAIGLVLMENVLRLQTTDPRIKFLFPEDGAIVQANVLALVKKESPQTETAKKVADWLFAKKGQEAMIKSYMYSPLAEYAAPTGAPELKVVLSKAQPWSKEFLENTLKSRESLKEEFTKIIF